MAGVLIAIDVALDSRIYSYAAQPADNLRRVGYLTLADNQVLGKEVYVVIDMLQGIVGDGHGGSRSRLYQPLLYQVDSRILNHFGINQETRDMRILAHCRKDGIAGSPYSTLNRQELRRDMPRPHVGNKEFGNVVSHLQCRGSQ